MQKTRPNGGIGRRKGLKILRWRHRAGSSPASGTKKMREIHKISLIFHILGAFGCKLMRTNRHLCVYKSTILNIWIKISRRIYANKGRRNKISGQIIYGLPALLLPFIGRNWFFQFRRSRFHRNRLYNPCQRRSILHARRTCVRPKA